MVVIKSGSITVIIPVYNCEAHLDKCIRSVIFQTKSDMEIIVVDDGSSDRSGAICDAFAEADGRIRVIHKKNGGAASARNAGLDKAAGEYVMFVDSDDWLEPDAAQTLIAAALKSGADIVRADSYTEGGRGAVLDTGALTAGRLIPKTEFKEKIYPLFFKGTSLNSVWKTLYRAEAVKGLRFDERLKTAEDLLFSIDAFTRAGSFIKIDRPVYHYNTVSGGLTKSGLKYLTRLKCNYAVSRAICSRCDVWGMGSIRLKVMAYGRLAVIVFLKLKFLLRKRYGFEQLR